jgi:hypothetical protein
VFVAILLRVVLGRGGISVHAVDNSLPFLLGPSALPKLQQLPRLDFEQSALNRGGAAQPPQQAPDRPLLGKLEVVGLGGSASTQARCAAWLSGHKPQVVALALAKRFAHHGDCICVCAWRAQFER